MPEKTYKVGNKEWTQAELDDLGMDKNGNETPEGHRQNTRLMDDEAIRQGLMTESDRMVPAKKKSGGKVKKHKKQVKAEGHKAKHRLDRKVHKDYIPSEGYKKGGKAK